MGGYMVTILGLALAMFLGVTVLAVVAAIIIYNRLVRLRTTVKSSWSDIDVHLKKRYDLVLNLVETVKGYAAHEKGVFENVTLARSTAMKANSLADKAKAENMFSETLKSLFAVAEAYPQLRANENFMHLQQQLKELEDNIEYARRYFNAGVRDFNIATETFPSNIVAGMFKFTSSEFFGLEEASVERKPVKVSFS
jgi:LemA protein